MAWRSSGTNNESMVDNLKRFGVVRTSAVEMAFRRVDRRFFVPRNQVALAHSDQPLREDHVHISAPHIYGTALEALELEADSSQSFLNLGSGTGYLSCMVATVLGPRAVHVAVEVHARTLAHARESTARWRAADPHRTATVPSLEMIHGNALHIDTERGEARTGFDRIYVGATVPRRKLQRIAQLLKPGGILVGPVDDDLVKVLRVGNEHKTLSEETTVPRSLGGQPPMLSNDFSVQILSGVRFASLVESPCIHTVLPSRIWEPAAHQRYPESFRRACKEILLCARSDQIQPEPPVVATARVNAASILPRALWMEVLSYTTRDWFDKPRNAEELLRRRLKDEQAAVREAQEARQRAEARVSMMERERDLYKLLLLRCQARLRTAGGSAAADEDGLDEDDFQQIVSITNRPGGFLRALRILRRSVARDNDAHDDDDDDDSDGHEDVDLEDSDDESESTAMEDVSVTNGERPMEDDNMVVSAHVARHQQARSVSIAGDDF